MKAKHFVLWCAIFLSLLSTGQTLAWVKALSKLDDLYRLVIKTEEMSQQAFRVVIRTGKISRFSRQIKSFPREDRIRLLLEVAEEKRLISGTHLSRLAPKYAKIDNGDDLLMKVIDHGDPRLFDLVPKYGEKLLSIETAHAGSGISVVTNLGEDGWKVVNKIPDAEVARFAAQSKGIASLESGTRTKVLDAIAAYPAKALEYLDKNSSIVYKGAAIGGFFVFINNLSKPDVEIETRPDGTVIEKSSGLFSKFGIESKYAKWFIWILLAGLTLWIIVQIWGSFRKKQVELKNLQDTADR